MQAYFLSARTSSLLQVELSSEFSALHPPSPSPSPLHANIILLHPQNLQHNSTFFLHNNTGSKLSLIKIQPMRNQPYMKRVELKYSGGELIDERNEKDKITSSRA